MKIKDQEREFNPSMSPSDFICANIHNLDDIYAKKNDTEMQIFVIGRMVECYEAFILLNY